MLALIALSPGVAAARTLPVGEVLVDGVHPTPGRVTLHPRFVVVRDRAPYSLYDLTGGRPIPVVQTLGPGPFRWVEPVGPLTPGYTIALRDRTGAEIARFVACDPIDFVPRHLRGARRVPDLAPWWLLPSALLVGALGFARWRRGARLL